MTPQVGMAIIVTMGKANAEAKNRVDELEAELDKLGGLSHMSTKPIPWSDMRLMIEAAFTAGYARGLANFAKQMSEIEKLETVE